MRRLLKPCCIYISLLLRNLQVLKHNLWLHQSSPTVLGSCIRKHSGDLDTPHLKQLSTVSKVSQESGCTALNTRLTLTASTRTLVIVPGLVVCRWISKALIRYIISFDRGLNNVVGYLQLVDLWTSGIWMSKPSSLFTVKEFCWFGWFAVRSNVILCWTSLRHYKNGRRTRNVESDTKSDSQRKA